MIHNFHQILFLASTTLTWEFTRLFPSSQLIEVCRTGFKLHRVVLLCSPHLSQRSAVSLCSRCREGWARSRMNGSQLYHGWAMKPLSQVAAAPGQVAFVPAHMHACSLFVPTLSRLCWFPLCLSTTQARCDCTVFQNRPYNHTAHTGDAMYELQPKCVAHTWHRLQAETCRGFYSESQPEIHRFLGFNEMRRFWTVAQAQMFDIYLIFNRLHFTHIFALANITCSTFSSSHLSLCFTLKSS